MPLASDVMTCPFIARLVRDQRMVLLPDVVEGKSYCAWNGAGSGERQVINAWKEKQCARLGGSKAFSLRSVGRIVV